MLVILLPQTIRLNMFWECHSKNTSMTDEVAKSSQIVQMLFIVHAPSHLLGSIYNQVIAYSPDLTVME
ncbi:hypothetical protein GUJ93_ZPchr0008g12879 [Zizania palustris]|uniref:Uncharacterized protein n=1 Tax=Zizania palustris TaxID=103762 RepID=A0A8J5UWU0_ZIZPA|nr:hypothetical protein GUJ93_ZPchr0008g12879 [Zizania palustris]